VDTAPILVVEDDDLVRSFLSRALAGLSGEVDACATGGDALRLVAGRSYGVILLDGLLPDTHGIELARKLVGQRAAARSGICFVSGSLRQPQSMRHGISALPKPLRVHELIDAVDLLLAWHDNVQGTLAQRLAALDLLSTELLVG
jgi:DNA-binding response OmpR family regulator